MSSLGWRELNTAEDKTIWQVFVDGLRQILPLMIGE